MVYKTHNIRILTHLRQCLDSFMFKTISCSDFQYGIRSNKLVGFSLDINESRQSTIQIWLKISRLNIVGIVYQSLTLCGVSSSSHHPAHHVTHATTDNAKSERGVLIATDMRLSNRAFCRVTVMINWFLWSVSRFVYLCCVDISR